MLRRRVYDSIFEDHLKRHRQMLFVTGPRQVGKTTSCRALGTSYQSWENLDVQRAIIKGGEVIAERIGLNLAQATQPVVVFDELHKFKKWKSTLKAVFDEYSDRCKILVTGSSRLDIYRRGGDSLMGRYFLYRMHPFSVAECVRTTIPAQEIQPAQPIAEADWQALWDFGGFPEPFLQREATFHRKWSSLRLQQLSKEDVRENSLTQNLSEIGVLIQILAERSAEQVSYASLAQEVATAPITVKKWISLLESLHYGFTVRPWAQRISNALRKEPKWYLRDWANVKSEGQKAETFVACHLLKACHAWSDLGLGAYELFYIRTKQKQEVDFLVARDGQPWGLFEVKLSERNIAPNLVSFAQQLRVPHAFQVVINLPYENVDCFSYKQPMVVPARTLLSQLV